MMRVAARLADDRRGVAALELALVAPLMLIMFFGVVEVTQLIRVSNKLDFASQAIENIVAGQNPATVVSVTNAYQGGELVMAPFVGTTNLAVTVASVIFDASGNASLAWQITEGGASAMSVATACGLAKGLGLGSDSVILVQASYSYSAITHYILPSSYALSHVAYGRPRNISTIAGVSSPTTAPVGSC
ncbi:TadE/TadG family type IV pilus assembly protein [Lichenicoccus sp.]|uniref:TadE/TadG family type IV pilus assembly protein n=1 Tax=Lichenicoccus sp. TaxID=2781899 RepID=UPI003D1263B0